MRQRPHARNRLCAVAAAAAAGGRGYAIDRESLRAALRCMALGEIMRLPRPADLNSKKTVRRPISGQRAHEPQWCTCGRARVLWARGAGAVFCGYTSSVQLRRRWRFTSRSGVGRRVPSQPGRLDRRSVPEVARNDWEKGTSARREQVALPHGHAASGAAWSMSWSGGAVTHTKPHRVSNHATGETRPPAETSHSSSQYLSNC